MPHPAMPWAGAQKWAAKPGDALAEIRSVGDFVIEPRAAQGRWLSRNVVSAHGREPETLDGLDFRPAKRHPVAAEPMDAVDGAGFGLSPTRTSDAASTANKIVNEAMEVMSYAALPAPYLRPDAELPSADRSSAEQKFTSEITRRYTDQAIRVHCIAFRLEEAFELFTHAYPGWVPWGPPSVRPRPSAAEVDERVLYSLSLGLVKTGSSARAELFLKHVETLFDDIPSAAYYFARMRVDMGLKRFDAAQAWYKKMADHPAKPLEDRHFVTRVIQTLMRIGQLTKNPKLSLYWLDVAHERHGLEPHLGSLRELLDSFAVVGDSSAVAKVWNLAQTIPVHSPATRKIYTDMLERCIWLYATPGSGTSYRQISYFVGKAIASGKLLPSPNTFATVMRAAAEEENYDAARDIMRTMESGEFGGEAFPAACKHYEQLLLALDRQLPHAGKATLDAVLKDDVAQERPSIGDRDAARILDRQTVARVLERALDLVDEMKERDIPLSGTIMSRLTRMLAFNATTRSEGIRLAMSALASLPRPDEGWSAYNQWAMPRGIGSFKGRASTATLVFTTLIKALSHTGEAENYNTALQAYDHFLQLRGSEELSVVDAAGILAIAGKADQTQYIERVWELSIKRAVDSKAVFDLPKGNEPGPSRPGELRSDGSDSFLANLHIALPDPSQAEPFVEQLSPAVQTLLRVVNQHITPASLLYLENEWLRVYRLGFGFDVGCWCELARAYLGAGRYERGFQIINDVVLFRHNQLLADFERAHGGSTVPDAPPFANEQAASTGLLSDEIQRAPPHYQDMVAKSYSLPLVPKGQMLHHQVMIKSLAQCGRTYGRSVGTVGPSMAYSKVAQDRRLLEEVFRALSWAPTGIIDALEEAQRMIRAEAVREWHEDTPELSGENPLQRAERFFANYPRVAQLLAIRQARQATDAPGVTRGWTI
jgi:tetratricopeptide (TPR) repeat protein